MYHNSNNPTGSSGGQGGGYQGYNPTIPDNNYNNQNVWYPTIKTFIQDKQGNWSDPIDKLYEFILEKYL